MLNKLICLILDHNLREIWIPANKAGVEYFIYQCTRCNWNEVHRFPNSQVTVNVPGLKKLLDDS